ncbi:hypothetical protein PUN28_015214 [Cardiocondyla obscurior]|uniref:Uncharacterized protein n=1 Tax=Cardiocondyla obscurior TaxID=286306 RepID=A0AAW2F188_9HYME
METTCSHYYNIVCKISSLTGMWPYLKPKTKVLRIALLTVILLTILIPQLAYQFMCKRDLNCTFKAMTAYLLSFVALLKVYTFQFNTRTIKDLTRHLFCAWKELNSSEEYEIMKSYATNSRRFSLIYSGETRHVIMREREKNIYVHTKYHTLQCIASRRYSSSCQCPLYRMLSTSYCLLTSLALYCRRTEDIISSMKENISFKFSGMLL